MQNIRAFFAARNVLEVQVPCLSSSSVTEVHIDSIPVKLLSGKTFLHTSPEYPMKRLLAAGIGDCFYLGPVFRQGESGEKHNPEFTMLEWYRIGFSIKDLAHEVIELAREIMDCDVEVQHYSYADVVHEYTGIDVFDTSVSEIQEVLNQKHIDIPGGLTDDFSSCLDLLVSTLVFPNLRSASEASRRITLIQGYPASQAALAKIQKDAQGRNVAARFEVFVEGVEIANGYDEVQDAELLAQRFLQDNQRRVALGKSPMPVDKYLLEAMRSGLPECAGVALGVDRLIMLALQKNSIKDVMAFPVERI